MEERPVIKRFFINFGITNIIIAAKAGVVNSKPTIDEIVSYLNTLSFVVPIAALICIINTLIEIVYYDKIRKKIFKDDNT